MHSLLCCVCTLTPLSPDEEKSPRASIDFPEHPGITSHQASGRREYVWTVGHSSVFAQK